MTLNQGVARFQHYAHETLAQMQDTLRTYQRVVDPSCRPHVTFLFEAMRQRVNFLLSQGKPLWHAVGQQTGEAYPVKAIKTASYAGAGLRLRDSAPK